MYKATSSTKSSQECSGRAHYSIILVFAIGCNMIIGAVVISIAVTLVVKLDVV